jgi:hypothetical protein
MSDAHWDYLIHAHFDETLTDAERAELSTLIRGSEAVRRRFWELAEVHALGRDAARMAWGDLDETPVIAASAVRKPSDPRRLTRFRPTMFMAAGVLIGVLMSSLAWAVVRPFAEPEIVLLTEGFESTLTPPLANGLPRAAGVWSGDLTELVTAQADVQPFGRHMLRFLTADYKGKPNPGGYIGEIYRLIDLRELRHSVDDGHAIVQVSARFNAGSMIEQNGFRTSLSLYALDATVLENGTLHRGSTLLDRALAVTSRSQQELDQDTQTWQRLSTELRLPPETKFLLLRVAVAHSESTRRASGHDKFEAHYVDDIRVLLARRPLLP